MGGLAQHFALATHGFDRFLRRLGKGMGLYGQSGGQCRLFIAQHDLVNRVFALGDQFAIEQTVKVDRGPFAARDEGGGRDDIVNGLGVARARGTAGEFGQAAVERCLAPFKAGTGGTTRPGLLSAHAKTTRSSLSSRDTASFSRFGFARARGRLEVVQSKHKVVHVVNGRFVGLPAFPVKHFHRNGTGAAGNKYTLSCDKGVTICCNKQRRQFDEKSEWLADGSWRVEFR
jgi:hypothetical protein